MRLFSTTIAGLVMIGCTTAPDAVVVNGVSKHAASTGKDHTNIGLGARFGGTEIGFYDNSRVRKSTSYYATHRVWQHGRFFADVGAAYYDSGSSYTSKVLPVGVIGMNVGLIEIGVVPTDLIIGRLIIK